MIKNKDVYNDCNCSCDQYKNCAECIEKDGGVCNWFENSWSIKTEDKMPMFRYEYEDDRKL